MKQNFDPQSFDPTWEKIYSEGRQLNKYPYTSVVSFFYRYRPQGVAVDQIQFLEIGFGGANNLWFLAREGVKVSGVEGSASAVEFAKKRFENDGLTGDLRVGDFTALPFSANQFDMSLDRAALQHTHMQVAKDAIAEVYRTLKPGGVFWSEGVSDRSTCRGRRIDSSMITDMVEGPLKEVGQISLYSRSQVVELFSNGWEIERLDHVETIDMTKSPYEMLALWHVMARKKK